MFKRKTPISGRLGNSSGGWIRTNDLRVMRGEPVFGNFDRKTLFFSKINVRWFKRERQTTVVDQSSYSISFSGGVKCFYFFSKDICNFSKKGGRRRRQNLINYGKSD